MFNHKFNVLCLLIFVVVFRRCWAADGMCEYMKPSQRLVLASSVGRFIGIIFMKKILYDDNIIHNLKGNAEKCMFCDGEETQRDGDGVMAELCWSVISPVARQVCQCRWRRHRCRPRLVLAVKMRDKKRWKIMKIYLKSCIWILCFINFS